MAKNTWMIATIVLGVVLVASVLTSGFNLSPSVESVTQDLKKIAANEGSAEVRAAVNTAISSLENVKKSNSMPTAMVAREPSGTAKIVIEEYSDFQCPFCSRAATTVEQVLETYGDDVELVYKHFPLRSIHPNAQKSAEASECARDQGMFKQYHDLLFANQNALAVTNLKAYAAQLGMDATQFNKCLDSSEKAPAVEADFQEGQQRGVRGTPAFFINGQMLSGAQPFTAFQAVIEPMLAE